MKTLWLSLILLFGFNATTAQELVSDDSSIVIAPTSLAGEQPWKEILDSASITGLDSVKRFTSNDNKFDYYEIHKKPERQADHSPYMTIKVSKKKGEVVGFVQHEQVVAREDGKVALKEKNTYWELKPFSKIENLSGNNANKSESQITYYRDFVQTNSEQEFYSNYPVGKKGEEINTSRSHDGMPSHDVMTLVAIKMVTDEKIGLAEHSETISESQQNDPVFVRKKEAEWFESRYQEPPSTGPIDLYQAAIDQSSENIKSNLEWFNSLNQEPAFNNNLTPNEALKFFFPEQDLVDLRGDDNNKPTIPLRDEASPKTTQPLRTTDLPLHLE